MPLFSRPDGVLVTNESYTHRIMPYLMPGRNEAMVQLEQKIDVTALLAYLQRVNAGRTERRVSLFHAVLTAAARAEHLRPKMNRFVVGHRIYQRNRLEFSFGVKKRMDDDGELTVVKMAFEPDDTLGNVIDRIDAVITRGREEKPTESEREMKLLLAMPRFLIRLAMGAMRLLDYFNLLPASMIAADELYCSMFLANLGSVGLEAPFHHLYEWGTAPLFCAIGKLEKSPVVGADGAIAVKDLLTVRWSFDERITDGFYCARSLDLFKDLLGHPEVLEKKPGELPFAEPADQKSDAALG